MARNIDTLFFILGQDRYGYDKKRAGTRFAELVFLHPVGSVGHVMHSSASGARNVNTLFFILGWDLYGYGKMRTWTPYPKYVFLHPVGSVGHVVYNSASGAQNVHAMFFMLGWDRYEFDKKHVRTRYAKLFFTSGGIYGSCSAFLCVRGTIRQRTILHSRVGPVGI
jgi:hypothetical protein